MTEIATMEDLEAVPIDETVTVSGISDGTNQTWTRTEGGLMFGSITLDLTSFTGAVASNLVTTGPVFEVGQWYQDADVRMYIAKVEGDAATAVFIYSDGSCAFDTLTTPRGARLTEPQDDENVVAGMARLWIGERDMRLSQSTSVAELRDQAVTAQSTLRSGMESSLRDLLPRFDDEDDRGRMREWMSDNGMTPPARTVNVSFTVSGRVEHSVNPREISSLFADRDEEVEVPFSMEIETTVEYTGSSSDPCEDRDFFDDDWVREYLDSEGITYSHYSIDIESRSCDHE